MMRELEHAISINFPPTTYKCVLSAPFRKDAPLRKVVCQRETQGFRLEKYTATQVFHEHIAPDDMPAYLLRALTDEFRQYHAWDDTHEYSIRISVKGKILTNRIVSEKAPQTQPQNNRQKRYLLAEGTLIPPLVDMGIFTKEGKVVNAMYDKYRQINRFLEMVDDVLPATNIPHPFRVIDFGCGKSYLTFVLYYYLTQVRKLQVEVTGLDLKADVIRKCTETARRYGYQDLHFELGDISNYRGNGKIDLVVTLHACDTATDYALFHAIKWGAHTILSVPCCQHELNGQIKSDTFSILTRYGIVKERMAALMTDAIRANLLTCCGYKTQLLEFIDLTHTPKNLLIRAVRSQPSPAMRQAAMNEVNRLITEFGLSPTLYHLLQENKTIPSLSSDTTKAFIK